jgi:phage shock protein A
MKMAKGTSASEKLKSIDEKISQLKAQKQAVRAREKNRERAERTRRLIQNGALAEQYLQCKDMATAQFELFLNALANSKGFADLIFQAQQDSLTLLQAEQAQTKEQETQSLDSANEG